MQPTCHERPNEHRHVTISANTVSSMLNSDLITSLEQIVGSTGVLRDPNELLTYESDGLARLKAKPGCVVLPNTAEEVQQIVRLCHARKIPFIARGHGTGLSGGALPRPDGEIGRASCRERVW